jgi:hypothetical protein
MSELMSQRPSGPLRSVSVNLPLSGSPACRAKPPTIHASDPSTPKAIARNTSGPPAPA